MTHVSWKCPATRQNLTLLDEASGVYTKINEPGPTVDPSIWRHCTRWWTSWLPPATSGRYAAACLPAAPPGLYADLVTAAQARSTRAILDTSETALRLGLAARPAGIKPNCEEAAQALGQAVSSDEEHMIAMRRLCDLLAPAKPPAPVVCLTRRARAAAGLRWGTGMG